MLIAAEASWIDLASRGGVVAILVMIIYGGFKKEPWWVFGWVFRDLLARHDKLRSEKDAWMTTAFKGTEIAESVAKLAASNSKGKE